MRSKPAILVVDDEEGMRHLMTEIIHLKTPYDAVSAANGDEAIAFLRDSVDKEHHDSADIRLVVTDLLMPGLDGESLLAQVRDLAPALPVRVAASHGSIDNAVNLVRRGAADYLTKPFKPVEFVQRIERVLENQKLQLENVRLKEELHRQHVVSEVIGNSKAIADVLKVVSTAAVSEALVMVYGESGTGKELVARAIHALSSRAQNKFVTVNCGALPDTLLENELFGHVKGAYSDAHQDQHGLVEEAIGGTLFLDEIGDISPAVQVKLLRFLQQKEFKRLGHSKVSTADVRLIAATNKDLREEVRRGRFRDDLYYRLNIIPILIPPLRQRTEDIPPLVNHFLKKFCSLYNRTIPLLTEKGMQKLMAYEWPGNIRELENKIQQIVVLTGKREIGPEDISLEHDEEVTRESIKPFNEAKSEMIARFERNYLTTLLSTHRGNVSRAARQAGKHRRAFFELMRKHKIEASTFRDQPLPDRE